MPRYLPPGGEIEWPAEEGTLGVVGLAPWATLAFCRTLYTAVRASKDWHFPRLLLDLNTKIPSRGRHLQLGEQDPSAAIADTIQELADQGATLAVVVCNTAHILYDRWSQGAPIPILHIIDETVARAVELGAQRVAPLVSTSLAKHDLYTEQATAAGLSCARLEPADQELVRALIERVKVDGEIAAPTDREAVRDLLERLREAGVDTVIAGCTELFVLEEPCAAAGLRLVDSNAALALAALRRLHLDPARIRT